MSFTRWLLAGIAITTVQFAVAQENGAAAEATEHVSGAVLDADTGQPINGARVQFFRANLVPTRKPSSAAIILTGKDGVFAGDIPADSVHRNVQVSAQGYLAENSRAFLHCSQCDATFRLHAKVAFTGRVVAADTADPVMRVQVEAFPFVSGELSKRSVGHVLTDNKGWFSLGQIPAGQYFLRFTPSDPVASLNLGDTEDTESRRFLTEWWPGSGDWQHASPVAVTGGSSLRVPDIRLSPDPRFTISGTLLPQYCQGEESFKVTILRSANGTSNMLRSVVVKCGAEYAFSDLTSGTYEIALDGSSGKASTRLDVQVRSENVRADLPVVEHPAPSGQP